MKEIDVIQYLPTIMGELKRGVLLNTKSRDKINSMTISWGQIGFKWNKLFFTAYIRHGRFTHKQIEESNQFTVSIPLDRRSVANAIGYCGSKSGENINKLEDMKLTVLKGIKVNSPSIKELPLTLECKVIYKQEQEPSNIPDVIKSFYYPNNVPSYNPMSNRDYHTIYYGEIVNAYIID